jgi:trk system potassium uptake protein
MNIIIIGGGEFGYQLAKELQINHDITVIDIDEKVFDRFSKLDISFINGNGANAQTLTNANIDHADIFIACTPSDETNIISCWTAKHLSKVETICFINHQEYIDTFKSQDNILLTNSKFGVDQIIWPKKSLADELEKIISVPGAIDVEVFAKGKVKLFEYRIKNTTPIVNKHLKNCDFPEGSIIVAIIRKDELFIPDGNTQLLENDKVIFMGTEQALEILSTSYFERRHTIRGVTIIGGGTVGYMLAQNLEKRNISTQIIESSYTRSEELKTLLPNTQVINGDGTDLELLQLLDIGKTDVLISITNNDEKNLLCSLLGKQLGIKKVLTRVSKSINLKLFETVGIDVALSPQSSSVKELLNNLLESDIDVLAIIEMGKGEVFETTVSDKFEDTQVKDLNFPFKAVIGAVMRRKKVIVPKGNTLIRPADKLLIFTTPKAKPKVKDYFEKYDS